MTSLTSQSCKLVGFLALTVALLGMGATARAQEVSPTAGQAGTTLTVTKTATGFYERRIQYKWTLAKLVSTHLIENLGVGAPPPNDHL